MNKYLKYVTNKSMQINIICEVIHTMNNFAFIYRTLKPIITNSIDASGKITLLRDKESLSF